MLDVTGMTVRQFEDLIDKPMMSCSSYYVELEGTRIVLSDWLNSYCLTVLVGDNTFTGYLNRFYQIADDIVFKGCCIEDVIKASLLDYLGFTSNYSKTLQVLLEFKDSLYRLYLLHKHRVLPLSEVFNKIKCLESKGTYVL
jgi:hypothetical protein